MSVPSLYVLAEKVTFNLYVPGYEHEDLIQECVTEAYEIVTVGFPDRWPPKSYLAQAMRFHVYSLLRKWNPLRDAVEYVDVTHVPMGVPVTIPIPISNPAARRIVIALLENDFLLNRAAKHLGISYRRARRTWCEAKRILHQNQGVVSYSQSEIYSLAEDEIYGHNNSANLIAHSNMGF